MILYQFYNVDMLDIPKDKSEDAMAFVDDTLLMATAENFTETHRTLAHMMGRAGGVSEWSKTHNSHLEYTKLALIDFAHSQNNKKSETLHLPQITVEPVSSAKYLGVIFDRNLNWKAQQAYAIGKGMKWTNQIRRIAKTTWGITPKYARQLYISVAIPRALYALDLWCNGAPLNGEHPGPRSQGASATTKKIATIQRAGAIAITGGLRTSPTDSLNACASLLPVPLLINKLCHRAFVRLTTLPKQHPLHKMLKAKSTRTGKRHRGPLQYLARLGDYDARNMEKIPVTTRDPSHAGRLPFQISIADDKESSAKDAETATEEIRVYTDGSAQEGKVGAAAILTRKNKPDRALHYHLGMEAEHTVHEAELIGILLGIHLINTERKGTTTCVIGVDNQAAIKAFDSDLRKPGHHIAHEILRIANQLRKKRKSAKYELTIRWTAGHVGIEGNEKADAEAKKASEGYTSDTKSIPPYLRKPLLINPAAVRRANYEKLKKEWSREWRQSERGQKTQQFDKTTPSKTFLKSISQGNLTREVASRLSQIRLTHIPLNSYLHRFKRTDSARCPACGEDEENLDHFLIRCPSYAYERWELTQAVRKKHKALTLNTLLGDPTMTTPLAKFITATQRFRTGELLPHSEQ